MHGTTTIVTYSRIFDYFETSSIAEHEPSAHTPYTVDEKQLLFTIIFLGKNREILEVFKHKHVSFNAKIMQQFCYPTLPE